MKRTLILALTLLLAMSFCACQKQEAPAPAAPATTAAPATEAPATTAPATEAPAAPAKRTAQVVKTGTPVTVMTAGDWSAKYPEIYASYMANGENDEIHDYVAAYPMIATIYEGMAFNTYYGSARGHVYTVEDVTATGRPHKLANCFSCKTPNFTAMVNELGDEAYRIPFEDALAQINEPISCYNCHANTGNELVVTHTYLADAMGKDLENVAPETLACAQCHVEYYFAPETKATTLPYSSLASMNPDAILKFYNEELLVDGQPFADYTNPRTGVRQIKVQHTEFETYMGAGSVHASTFTCADCHMGEATADNGTTYINHTWTSPLDNQTLVDNTCAACHKDLAGMVKGIQDKMEERTINIGNQLEELTEKLVVAVESGEYTEEELNAIRAVARDAQFYWDFVFVENSEGAHNSKLDNECLDKAEALIAQALGMFK